MTTTPDKELAMTENLAIRGTTEHYTVFVTGEANRPLFWIKPNGESWVAENVTEAARVFVDAVSKMIAAPSASTDAL